MKNLTLVILTLSFSVIASDPELSIHTKIASLTDNQNRSSQIQEGSKIRTQLKVYVIAKTLAKVDGKAWLIKHLPKYVKGYLETTNEQNNQKTRFDSMPFQLNVRNTYCAPGENPRYNICKAEYQRKQGNTILIPSNYPGEYSIQLALENIKTGLDLKIEEPVAKNYVVTAPERQLGSEPYLSSMIPIRTR